MTTLDAGTLVTVTRRLNELRSQVSLSLSVSPPTSIQIVMQLLTLSPRIDSQRAPALAEFLLGEMSLESAATFPAGVWGDNLCASLNDLLVFDLGAFIAEQAALGMRHLQSREVLCHCGVVVEEHARRHCQSVAQVRLYTKEILQPFRMLLLMLQDCFKLTLGAATDVVDAGSTSVHDLALSVQEVWSASCHSLEMQRRETLAELERVSVVLSRQLVALCTLLEGTSTSVQQTTSESLLEALSNAFSFCDRATNSEVITFHESTEQFNHLFRHFPDLRQRVFALANTFHRRLTSELEYLDAVEDMIANFERTVELQATQRRALRQVLDDEEHHRADIDVDSDIAWSVLQQKRDSEVVEVVVRHKIQSAPALSSQVCHKRAAWYDTPSDDEDCRPHHADGVRCPSLNALLCSSLTALCNDRGFLSSTFFTSWRATAVQETIGFCVMPGVGPAVLRSIDMKDLLCELLDVWSLFRHRLDAPLEAGEQAMRDVALVVHVVLQRAVVFGVAQHGPCISVPCRIPSSHDSAECLKTYDNIFQAIWFQVDPLGVMSGGYLLPSVAAGGVRPLGNHSFGFLSLSRIRLTVGDSRVECLALEYDTLLTTTDNLCVKGATLDDELKELRTTQNISSKTSVERRLTAVRKALYCFSKLEKHNLLFRANVDTGYACKLDAVNAVSLTESIVLWKNPLGEVLCVGLLPPHALRILRSYRCALPISVSTPVSDMHLSVVAQLALLVQRLGMFATPVIVPLVEAAEAITDAVMGGGQLQAPVVSVLSFLRYVDDVLDVIGAASHDDVAKDSSGPIVCDVNSHDDDDDVRLDTLNASKKSWNSCNMSACFEIPQISPSPAGRSMTTAFQHELRRSFSQSTASREDVRNLVAAVRRVLPPRGTPARSTSASRTKSPVRTSASKSSQCEIVLLQGDTLPYPQKSSTWIARKQYEDTFAPILNRLECESLHSNDSLLVSCGTNSDKDFLEFARGVVWPSFADGKENVGGGRLQLVAVLSVGNKANSFVRPLVAVRFDA